ncbi:branched-chain amino acid ABC transporter permease [candidate division KSB3 bacterium]|uniref:Branched-chain amino acid ABC transporter permease n=1 Tax=candidate division KSB3 bacterium TaxID=2044937 RepID=A0A9D5JXE3_9BACT|nr:branched-chain amino acid ABC transporter permease [candidate division KSB3 bacterium]MBD3325885.1 branched-chain amino acid ABC transporter permease [candidate division KSB3 bacterium]
MFSQILANGFAMGTCYALVAMGMSIIYGAVDLINFAQGEFLMVGAFIGLTTIVLWSFPLLVGFLISIPVLFILGYLMDKYFVRSLIRKGFTGHLPTVLLTLAFAITARNAAMLIWGSEAHPFPALFDNKVRNILGVMISPQTIIVSLISVSIMIAVILFLKFTKLGRAMIATAYSRETASLMGINIWFIGSVAFGLSFVVSGVSGILVAPQFTAQFDMGILLGLKGFTAAILGGLGNLYGAIIGGIILGMLEGLSAGFISSVWKDGITFILVIAFLLFKPKGILGKPGGGLF